MNFMDHERVRRRRLPHWDVPDGAYFVTTCLQGSIPACGLLDLFRFRDELSQRPQPKGMTPEEWRTYCWKLHFAQSDHWLDKQPACQAAS
jgi:putative transposase